MDIAYNVRTTYLPYFNVSFIEYNISDLHSAKH